MPPKARGRGGTRARGSARGGAAAGRSTTGDNESTENATPQSIAPAAVMESLAAPIIPKQEDDVDAKPPVTVEDGVVTIEAQGSSSGAAAYVLLLPDVYLANRCQELQKGLPKPAQNPPLVLQFKDSAVYLVQFHLHDPHRLRSGAVAAQPEARGV